MPAVNRSQTGSVPATAGTNTRMSEQGDGRLVEEVRAKAGELERLLETFSGRLRRMREQNKRVQEEISEFESELERLRDWLSENV